MARFQLNNKKPNNYAFFCPKSRLHLTVSNPVGSVNEVTTDIIRAVKSKTLLDIDRVINLKNNQTQTEAMNTKNEPPAETASTESSNTDSQQEKEPENKPKRKTRKTAVEPSEPEAEPEKAAE